MLACCLFDLLRQGFIVQSRLELEILWPHAGIISMCHLTAGSFTYLNSYTRLCVVDKGTALATGQGEPLSSATKETQEEKQSLAPLRF